MTIKLWHCKDARSLRAVWALEEMGIPYELITLQFPPRAFHKDYKEINPLGTIPYLVDGETSMTESTGICHYLVEKYQRHDFGLQPSHKEYGDYLNWLYHSDATLTFPQALVLRYSRMEPDDRKQPQVAEDYSKWYIARLKRLDAHIPDRDYLCDNRFTIADIAIGYALYLGESLGLDTEYQPQTKAYLERLKARSGFQCAIER